jgi:glycosyltransferase involved in cell wall biosynthesis
MIDNSLTELAGVSAEVIVVDNASTDETQSAALASFKQLLSANYRIIREIRPGQMNARIAGARAAVGDFICFLDDDNWASADYFRAVLTTFNTKPAVGYFGCSTRLPRDRIFPPEIAPFDTSYAVGDLYTNSRFLAPGQVVWGAGFATRRVALARILESKFQPILVGRIGSVQLAGDDSELAHALSISGWTGWYECTPLIEHAIDVRRMNPEKLLEMYRGFGASNSVLSRYSLFSRGELKTALALFPYWYSVKIAKNIAGSLGLAIAGKRLRAQCFFVAYKTAIGFFFGNRKIWTVQQHNLRVLSGIRHQYSNRRQ